MSLEAAFRLFLEKALELGDTVPQNGADNKVYLAGVI